MATLLIKNGTVYDGTGEKGRKADVYVRDGRIEKIGECPGEADRVIDAAGMAVTPGFVDMHRHCDIKPFKGGRFGDAELAQGITTAVAGNCGISMTPCNPERAAEMYDFMEPVLGSAYEGELYRYRDYMARLDGAALPLNFCSMIGTGSVKITVKGFEDKPFTEREIEEARGLIEDALKEGAVGISVGIMYIPECYSTTEEFARILEPVGRYGGVVTAHIRGEGDSLVNSIREVIEIGRKAGCAMHVSHFKSCGMKNWRREIHKAIAEIDGARARGQDVTCDFYPYEGGSTSLTTMIPPVFVAGDMNRALERLGTEEGVEEFRRACAVSYSDWDNYAVSLGWDRIMISGVTKERNQKFVGKSVAESAAAFGFPDSDACAAYLLHDEDGKVAIISMSMCQEDIDVVAKLPYAIVISDSIYAETDTPHPRLYGAFPKIIREYVRERKLYTLEEAIYRMTLMPAERIGLAQRGRLAEGYWADINVFDPAVFRDNATYEAPARLATGLSYCIVNGNIAIDHDRRSPENFGVNIRASKR